MWYTKLTGDCPSIASPDYWDRLLKDKGYLKRLIEYDDDTWEIIRC